MIEQDAIEKILGWEFHQSQVIKRPDGSDLALGSWSPPGVSAGDIYGVTVTCDHLLQWLEANTPKSRTYTFGGRPGLFWASLDNSIQPTYHHQPTLFQALSQLVRYVDRWKGML